MVSVVIPNYNGSKYFKDCIEALDKQTYRDYEVIVIDNASTDDDYRWLTKREDIIFKRLDKNYGFSKAVNEGIKMAKGEYVLLLNNDTVPFADFIQELVKMIEQDKQLFAVSSKMIQYHNNHLIDDAGDEYTILGWAYKRGDGMPVTKYTQSGKVFSACGGAAIYRKEVFEKIGYFDENFFAYMEDVDISYRALIYGYKNMYCADAKVEHIGSATSGSKYNAFKVKLAARNNVYVAYKNMPVLQLIINFPFLLTGFVIKYVFFIGKGFGKEYREGFTEGVKSLGHIKKIPFKLNHLLNYIYIEWLLIKNLFGYIILKLIK